MSARGEVDPPHDAEVEGDDPALRVDQHVAGMHVGMEEAVAEHLIEEDHRRLGQDRVGIEAVPDQLGALVGRQARDPLEGHHPAARAAPVHLRHLEALVLEAVLAELGRGRGLQAQVHLVPGGGGQHAHVSTGR